MNIFVVAFYMFGSVGWLMAAFWPDCPRIFRTAACIIAAIVSAYPVMKAFGLVAD